MPRVDAHRPPPRRALAFVILAAALVAPLASTALPAAAAEPVTNATAEVSDPLATLALEPLEPTAAAIDPLAILASDDPAADSPWRAWLAHTAVEVSWDADGKVHAAGGAAQAPVRRPGAADAHSELVVVEGGARPRAALDAYGTRVLLHIPASALLLVPGERIELLPTPGATPPAADQPGVVLAAGARLDLGDLSEDGRYIAVTHHCREQRLLVRGWLPVASLTRVYRTAPLEPPAAAEQVFIEGSTVVRTSPDTGAEVAEITPESGAGVALERLRTSDDGKHLLVRLVAPTVEVRGWLPAAVVSEPGRHRETMRGERSGWGMPDATWALVAGGTDLRSEIDGPVVARQLPGGQRLRLAASPRDGHVELDASTPFGLVRLVAPTDTVTVE